MALFTSSGNIGRIMTTTTTEPKPNLEGLRAKLSLHLSQIDAARDGAERGILHGMAALQLARGDLIEGNLDSEEIAVLLRIVIDYLVVATAHIHTARQPFEYAKALLQAMKGGAQ